MTKICMLAAACNGSTIPSLALSSFPIRLLSLRGRNVDRLCPACRWAPATTPSLATGSVIRRKTWPLTRRKASLAVRQKSPLASFSSEITTQVARPDVPPLAGIATELTCRNVAKVLYLRQPGEYMLVLSRTWFALVTDTRAERHAVSLVADRLLTFSAPPRRPSAFHGGRLKKTVGTAPRQVTWKNGRVHG